MMSIGINNSYLSVSDTVMYIVGSSLPWKIFYEMNRRNSSVFFFILTQRIVLKLLRNHTLEIYTRSGQSIFTSDKVLKLFHQTCTLGKTRAIHECNRGSHIGDSQVKVKRKAKSTHLSYTAYILCWHCVHIICHDLSWCFPRNENHCPSL